MSIFKRRPAAATPVGGNGGCVTFIFLLVAVLTGLAAGVRWHDSIAHRLGLHGAHTPTTGTGTAAPSGDERGQLWTCSMHPQVIQKEPGLCPICHMQLVPLSQGPNGGQAKGVLQIDPAVVQNMGVRTAHVDRGRIHRDIRATGYLRESEPNIHEINLRVNGWIEKLYADTDGMYIEKGRPLFELYSPEIHQAVSELISLRSRGEHSQSLVSAAAHRLELWGLGAAQIAALAKMDEAPRTVTFLSPVSGHVLEKKVVEGAGISAGAMLFNIVNHHTLWLDIAVFEQDLPFISLGLPVEATLEALPGQTLSGEVVFIHPHVEMDARTAAVRLAIHNADMQLRPGMYATAHIEAVYAEDALRAPREAIMDTGSRLYTFVDLGNGHFAPRDIEMGAQGSDGKVEIRSGLSEDDIVVTSGQFLLDTESRLQEAVQKFLAVAETVAEPMTESMNASDDRAAPPLEPDPKATPAATEISPETDALFEAYLSISAALGVAPTDDKGLDMAPLIGAANTLLKNEAHPARQTTEALLTAATAMEGNALEDQRKAFGALSDAMIELASQFAPSGKVTPNLFIIHCPMAPGSWIQPGESVANPYYRDAMKQCGNVVRPLPAMAESTS